MSSAVDISKLPVVRGEYKFDENLSKYTWFNVGGPAEVLFLPADEDDLCYFLQQKPQDIDVFILGGGSNILVRDGGIAGVVIKLKSESFSNYHLQDNLLYVGAGMRNLTMRQIIEKNALGGLEFICSIPGSIGGMIRTNAGCFGSDIASVLQKARVCDSNGRIFDVPVSDFHFKYRHSEFPSDWIVLGIYLKYTPDTTENVKKIIADHMQYRQEHQPKHVRTAGSTFKNPQGYKAWQLIKAANADSIQVGGAKMSDMHCNFLVNDGTATAADIENLIYQVVDKVKEKSGITLDLEVKIIGQKVK